MTSLIYTSAIDDMAHGLIDFGADDFKGMLVTGDYVADQSGHDKREDVSNEASGTGYTAGGTPCTVTVTKNAEDANVVIEFGEIFWPSSTITARGCVYYKSRGGAASLDELVAYNDFGSNVSSTARRFNIGPTTINVATNLATGAIVSIPSAGYTLNVSSGTTVEAEEAALLGDPIIPVMGTTFNYLDVGPLADSYERFVMAATYSSSEMSAACGGAGSATIVGMRLETIEAPSSFTQPFEGYSIGAKNTTNSTVTNNSGATGGTFTLVYGPADENFVTGETKQFLFDTPIVWTGSNFVFSWARCGSDYSNEGSTEYGDGPLFFSDAVTPGCFLVTDVATITQADTRPVFRLLYNP